MLYNPAWRDPAPLTLPKLIAWLERQPAAQEYDFFCNGHCLLAQYLKSCGYEKPFVEGWDWYPSRKEGKQPLSLDFQHIAVQRPYTFGAALARARTALAEAKMTPAEEPVS